MIWRSSTAINQLDREVLVLLLNILWAFSSFLSSEEAGG